ncbi:MAG TPA: hypothetical protein VGH56_08500 [Solirubrobacteraceae bacterium]
MTPPGPRAEKPNPGVLVISRSVGEGFSIGDEWHFLVAAINAQFVTLTVTGANTDATFRLQVNDALHITARNKLQRRRSTSGSSTHLSPAGVTVSRVTSNDARLAVHAPRALKIHRHEHDIATGATPA